MRHHLTLAELAAGLALLGASILSTIQGVWAALIDVGLVVGAMATIIAAVAAAGRTPPIRALFRRLVRDPIDEWAEHTIVRHTSPLADALERHGQGLAVLAEVIADPDIRERYSDALEKEAPDHE